MKHKMYGKVRSFCVAVYGCAAGAEKESTLGDKFIKTLQANYLFIQGFVTSGFF